MFPLQVNPVAQKPPCSIVKEITVNAKMGEEDDPPSKVTGTGRFVDFFVPC
jgi:hypothetical protein